MARMVKCVKLGREAEGLDFPPYPGELGKRVFENVSKEAWKQWLEQQKMLVNENRLNLADKKSRDYLIAKTLVATLEGLPLEYPAVSSEARKLRKKLS